MSGYRIEHQPGQARFVLLKETKECVLYYQLEGDTVDFSHTYVPFAVRGQGLAEVLVEQGLHWARQQGYCIQASCWYVRKFL